MKKKSSKSAAKPGSADHPSPMNYTAVLHPGASMRNKGQWLGHFAPDKIPVVKILKELQGKK